MDDLLRGEKKKKKYPCHCCFALNNTKELRVNPDSRSMENADPRDENIVRAIGSLSCSRRMKIKLFSLIQ